jgi:hypothetical protein
MKPGVTKEKLYTRVVLLSFEGIREELTRFEVPIEQNMFSPNFFLDGDLYLKSERCQKFKLSSRG